MNTNESSDLGTESNNPTTNEGTSVPFDIKNLSSIVSEKFLNGEEQENSNSEKSEDSSADNEATAEEDTVHSQNTEEDTTNTETEDSEETEETKSTEEEFDRGLPKGVKKRIDKLSAKRREAEEEVSRLKGEVERLSQEAVKPAQTPTADNPFSNLSTLDEVNKEFDQSKQIRRWCEMNPDGAVVTNANGEEVEYTSDDVRKIKIKAMDAMEDHLPKRAQYLQNYQQIEQVATKEYPWWKDKSTRERQIAEAFLKSFPEIQRFPDYKMVLGDYIRGVKSREANSKGNKNISRAPSQPKSNYSPASVSKSDEKASVAKQRFSKDGNSDDLSSIIASRFL
jgi:hypothetical protein